MDYRLQRHNIIYPVPSKLEQEEEEEEEEEEKELKSKRQ